MRVMIDANILYPTVLRGIVIGCAARGLFLPCWSPRVLEEWARAVARDGVPAETFVRGEVAALRARFPAAEVVPPEDEPAHLWLPDPADIHVLAAAIAGGCKVILTRNRRDFPHHVLRGHGITREDPDSFLLGLPRDGVAQAVDAELALLRDLSGDDWSRRRMLRKATLPRLARALDTRGDGPLTP